MYDLPSRDDISKVVIDAAVVRDRVAPSLVPHEKKKPTRARRQAS